MTLILSGSNGLSDVDGSAATPAIRGTDANTGMFFPAADTIAFAEGGVESMRITSAGDVGIGTSSPAAVAGKHLQIGTKTHLMQLTVNDVSYLTNNIWYNGTNWIADTTGASSLIGVGSTGFVAYNGASVSGGSVATLVGSLAVDLSGNLQFNSGYGGVATAYGCRAWVKFNGSTGSILGSANVSSVTRDGLGLYTVSFTTAMPDTNYAATGMARSYLNTQGFSGAIQFRNGGTYSTTAIQLLSSYGNTSALVDLDPTCVAFFR